MAKKPSPVADAEQSTEAPGGGRKKKLLIVLVVAAVAAAAAAYFLVFKSGDAEAKEPEPGPVLTMEPITVNLADGRYLKVGIALQLTAEAAGGGHGGGSGPDGSKALDITIDTLSNRDAAELSSNEARRKVKDKLAKEIEYAYHGEVMDLYFTEFVMQ